MNSNQILEDWQKSKDLEPKQKYKRLKYLCHQIVFSIKSEEIQGEDVDDCIALLNDAIKIFDAPPNLNKARSNLVLLKLKSLGIDPDKVNYLINKSKTICLESATFGIGDPTLIDNSPEMISHEAINNKKRFYFSTGGDGHFKINLRILDISHPVLKLNEYKKVLSSTGMAQIIINSGELHVGDITNSEKKTSMNLKIEPGLYNISSFLLSGKNGPSHYCIVMGRADSEIDVNLSGIESLEFVG